MFIEGGNVSKVVKALSNDIRIKILQMLSDSDMNVQSIAARLSLSKTAVLTHINILEESGFIKSKYLSGSIGNQRICSCVYERLVFDIIPGKNDDDGGAYYEVEVPIGNFFDFEAYAPCGLATNHNVIKKWDDPSVMCDPERMNTCFLWTAFGYFEYKIPIDPLFVNKKITAIEIDMEISAHHMVRHHKALKLPGYMTPERITDGISDVTFWLDGTEIGMRTIIEGVDPSKATYTPSWWRNIPVHGTLVKVALGPKGAYINGEKTSDLTYDEVCREDGFVRFRVGVKEDAFHSGGIMIFGKHFGRYGNDIIVKTYIE